MSRLTYLPNFLTLLRLALVPVLIFVSWKGHAFIFIGLLSFAFLTDALDGFIARTFNLESKLGAKLDSLADFVVYMAIPICAWLLWPEVIQKEKAYVIAIVVSILLPVLVGIFKFGNYPSYHTWMTKVAAIAMALSSMFLFSGGSANLFHIATFICVIAALEEVMITIFLSESRSNVQSLYHVIRRRD